jgi:hypothetical protein
MFKLIELFFSRLDKSVHSIKLIKFKSNFLFLSANLYDKGKFN